jgi:hypothetical protein
VSDETKALLKSAGGNIFAIAGGVSTAATFFPFMVIVRPYLRPFGVALIIAGIFQGARSVIAAKNEQFAAIKSEKRHEIETVRAEKDSEVAALNKRIEELSRKPYTEELKRITEQVLDHEMTLEGGHVLRHLMIHEPIELGRAFIPQISQEHQHAQLAIAMQHGLVQHREEGQGLRRTYWVINPRFRPVLEDVLYESGRL